jgi:glycosyltransferase involved in cell wall biosynthesis
MAQRITRGSIWGYRRAARCLNMHGSFKDVSVVIPVHNGEFFVCEAIASALGQTGVSVEVIVVDNLSTDRTREVVEAACGGSVTLAFEPHRGPAAARNCGARLATGTHLAFLDADDLWAPDKLERQIHELATRPGIDMVFGHCQDFHDPRLAPEERSRLQCRPEPYPSLSATTVLVRRETFRRAGDFPDVQAGEFIAWFGWAQSLGLRAFVMPDVLAKRRVHGRNWSLNRGALADYPMAAKWLLDKRRRAQASCSG